MACFQVTQIFYSTAQAEESSLAQRKVWENPTGVWIAC